MGAESAFVAVQGFIGLFLLLHDWVPLGPFNDLEGVNSQIPYNGKCGRRLLTPFQLVWHSSSRFGRWDIPILRPNRPLARPDSHLSLPRIGRGSKLDS
jgi:hypothetical protein